MSNLKNVRAELEKMKKEMAAKEAELKREEVRPVIELINNELLNSEDVQEKMSAYKRCIGSNDQYGCRFDFGWCESVFDETG